MATPPRQMILGLLVNGVGQHQAGWRLPESRVEDTYHLSLYRDAALLAEAAKIHFVFYADSADHKHDTLRARPARFLESLSLASATAALTSRIGVVATFSTSFTEPYNVARQMCSLDHISGGRSGWNMVTSYGGAAHYSDAPLADHATRHKRAAEYADVVRMLFNSWDEDALTLDRGIPLFADPDKVHIDFYDGEIFKVQGPLNIPRPPQGRPIIAQAGQSDSGKNLAAQHADMVYAQAPSLEEGQALYADMKGRMPRYGRHPDQLKILPGCVPVVGETEADALRMERQLGDFLDFEVGKSLLQERMPGVDLKQFALTDVVPESAFLPTGQVVAMQYRYELIKHLSVDRGFTVRQLIERMTNGGGHWAPVGAAEQVAAEMQERFAAGACDGFNLSSLYQLGGIERITQLLVPALQAKGWFRTEYEGATLRENMGLAQPLPHAVARYG